MTDRSSEERSRFEKWWESEIEEAVAGMVAKSYARDAWMARAALEDRQEAAPKFDDTEACQHRSCSGKICARPRSEHGPISERAHAFVPRKSRSEESAIPGVPSEATPSKEKETVAALRELNFALAEEVARLGKKSGPRVIAAQSKLDRLDWTASDQVFTGPTPEMQAVRRKYHEAAPAPEVQGTPTKSNVAHQPWCASAPRPMDAPMGRGPYPCDCGTVKASPAPVETPQKETPQISKEVAAWRNLYPSAEFSSVPEGVQGKEPQTFDEWWSVKQPFDGDSPAGAKFWARKSWAAGRRSAITELQEWAEQKHKYERQIRAAIVYRDVLAKCAELLEKP